MLHIFRDHCYHASAAAARRETHAHGRRLRSLAGTCGRLLSAVTAVTCGHLRSLALGGLSAVSRRSLAVTCGHVLSAVTCGHLRSLEWLRVTASGWFSENQIPHSPRAQWDISKNPWIHWCTKFSYPPIEAFLLDDIYLVVMIIQRW